MKEKTLKIFAENVLDKEVPLYTLKAIMYMIALETESFDIDEIAKKMYISKKKLTNELDKIKPIDSLLVVEKDDEGDYVLILLEEVKLTLKHPKKKTKKKKTTKVVESEDPVVIVFEYWKEVMGKTSRTSLDTTRRRTIVTALQNLTVDEMKLAILGCSKSPWHMGHNPNAKRYDSLELIFRNATYIEGFIDDANGLTLEEKLENEINSKPKSMEARLEDNDWLQKRMRDFDGNQEEVKNIDNKKQILLENKETINYDVELLISKSKGFFKVKEVASDDEIIEEAEFSFLEESEEDNDIPLYLRMTKNNK